MFNSDQCVSDAWIPYDGERTIESPYLLSVAREIVNSAIDEVLLHGAVVTGLVALEIFPYRNRGWIVRAVVGSTPVEIDSSQRWPR